MANYSSKFRVFQDWGSPEAGTAGPQNVFVFGPKYMLSRYTDESEKAQIEPIHFNAAGGSYTFKNAIEDVVDYEVRKDFVSVYVEDAFVKIAEIDTSDAFVDGDYTDGKIVVRSDVAPAAKGDYLYYTDPDGVSDNIKIQSVEPVEDAEYGDVKWFEIQLVTGLDDSFEAGIPAGYRLYTAKKLDSVKVNDAAVSIEGEDASIDLDEAVASGTLLEGNAFFSVKRLYIGESGSISVLTSVGDVEDALGPADPENPLSLGVYNAFLGGASVVYWYMTSGEKKESFDKALDRATLDSSLYYFVPMTQDYEILQSVARYCDTQSDKDHKRWRISICCSDVGYTKVSTDYEVTGTGEYGTSAKYVTLKFDGGAPDVVTGDTVSVGDIEFRVTRRLNKTTVLTSTRVDAIDTPVKGAAVVTHERTNSEYATAVAGSASRFGTQRVVDVFPKRYKFVGDEYSGMFLAPVIAGIAASVEPQAPITNKAVPCVDDIPDVYSRLSSTDLDTIAAGGVLIVTQDVEGGNCYIRKQLTAGTPSGVLAKSELSMVKNYDNIAMAFNGVMEGFKGSYNVTQELVRTVNVRLKDMIYYLQNNQVSSLIGPQLLGDSRVERVAVDPSNRAKILAWVHCDLPVPFNDMDLFLSVVTTAESAGIQAIQTAQE
jgi:hypothetical protein